MPNHRQSNKKGKGRGKGKGKRKSKRKTAPQNDFNTFISLH